MFQSINPVSFRSAYATNATHSLSPNLQRGLVAAWMPGFGVTGSSLKDLSGHSYDATLENMDPSTDWITSSQGRALSLDGVNDYLDATTLGGRDHLTKPFSITFLAKINNYDTSQYFFTKLQGSDSQICTILWIAGDGSFEYKSFPRVSISTRGVELKFGDQSSLLEGVWRTYTVTGGADFNQWSNYTVYIDGKALTPSSTRNNGNSIQSAAAGTLVFGGRKFDNNRNLPMDFAGSYVHDRKLAASEVKQLHLDIHSAFYRRPTAKRTAFVGGGPGPTFQPAWAMNATVIIQ